ncbi:MAG: alpha/beta fold hydrolase [Solirubrobacterales bacterium]
MNGRSWENTADRMARRVREAPKGLVGLALGAGAALTGLAFWSSQASKDAERANPPTGTFIEIGGAKLHYLARGSGRPVVFIHGLGGMIQDWTLSLADRAARGYRCIAFDRPGYGWSERPGWSRWSPEKQAETLRRAARRMGAERPVLVAHDFGTLVALSWALEYPEDVAGIVLIAGYYYSTRRIDIPLLSVPSMAGLGAVARNTVSPMLGRAAMPKVMERLFAPNPVPDVMSLYPTDMMLRPSQMRAQGEDLAHLKEATRRLSSRYGELRVPVVIVTGDGDTVVDPVTQSIRLHRDIPHSTVKVVAEAGHMVHHVAPADVMSAIDLAWHESELQALAMGPVAGAASGRGAPVQAEPPPMPAAGTQPHGGH